MTCTSFTYLSCGVTGKPFYITFANEDSKIIASFWNQSTGWFVSFSLNIKGHPHSETKQGVFLGNPILNAI